MTKTKNVTSNQDLESFLTNGKPTFNDSPWHGLDPDANRTGSKAFSVVCNEYEKAIISAASKKDSNSMAGFIRQAAIKRAKVILDL